MTRTAGVDSKPSVEWTVLRAAFGAALLSGPGVTFFMALGEIARKLVQAPTLGAGILAVSSDDLFMLFLGPIFSFPLMIVPALLGFVPVLLAIAAMAMIARQSPFFQKYSLWMIAGGLFGALVLPVIFVAVSGTPPTPLSSSDALAAGGVGAADGVVCAAFARWLLRRVFVRG